MAQFVFCAWLLILAGLFARSLSQLRAVDLGFRKQNLITLRLDPGVAGYKAADSVAVGRRVEEALAALPGVSATASSDYGVLGNSGIEISRLEIEGYQPENPEDTIVYELAVTPGFVRALGLRLLAGRDFAEPDMGPARTAIVNEAFARRYFGGQNPVGRHIRSVFSKAGALEIVGLVKDHRYFDVAQEPRPFYYLPARYVAEICYYVRTAQAPERLMPAIRSVVERQAPGVPLTRLRTMEEQVDGMMDSEKQMAALAGLFGLLATVLAAIGLYGVMAYTVARRTREIGIRMALGAARRNVLAMVIREVALVIAAGLLVGVPSGLAMARLIRSQLYNVSPMDPPTAAAATAVVAGLLPARRATRIDPIRALRWE